MVGSEGSFAAHARQFEQARQVLAGGVSASLRVNHAVNHPVYMERADGPFLFDTSGRQFIDLSLSNGAAILGHRHPALLDALDAVRERGFLTATESPDHARLAETLVALIPSAERVRFSTTGVEATMLATRVARSLTGRPALVKFEGHFHGLYDAFMYNQHLPLAAPDAAPTPESAGLIGAPGQTVVLPWNDRAAVERALDEQGDRVAAVICEPINYNSGCIPPAPGFLQFLREATGARGIVLIFDEVLSGFRMGVGGAQAYYGVTPDISTLAKALAGGVPLSATVGSADAMAPVSAGRAAHSGTYSGHLLGVLAARATLDVLAAPGTYERLNADADWFYSELQAALNRAGLRARVQGIGARFGIYVGVDPDRPILTYAQASAHDSARYNRFIAAALARGVYIHSYGKTYAPGHAGISVVHTREVLAETLERLAAAAADCAGGAA
ncbi:MAG TPA: aminotransferase class III-fold pyridoxal phosphate-dependent enzyme [Thermomicrobiaceae bacterium]|nr:aminotransferase class III-fold pyridoxal phosphate-dependent enzyme [Thermomicrobiaceae bacterium]